MITTRGFLEKLKNDLLILKRDFAKLADDIDYICSRINNELGKELLDDHKTTRKL